MSGIGCGAARTRDRRTGRFAGCRRQDPKSSAGRRIVPIPAALLDDLGRHLDQFAQPGESGGVFVGGKGGMLRRQNFRKIWLKAVAESGVPEVHFHDLRHTGNTLVAENSATVRR